MTIKSALKWIVSLTIALAGGAGITLVFNGSLSVDVDVTPPEAREGWAGPEALADAKEAGAFADLPEFRIVGAQGDNSEKDVRLWEFTKAVNGGEHLPNYPQQIGDCVSFGAKNAIEYLQCVQIARGPPAEFHPVYPPYLYGTGRVQIGKGRLRGDGSLGIWQAKAVQQYGVLAADHPDCPKYSGSVARDWGRSGPPDWALTEGRQWLVKTIANVTTAEEVRDAICNGYPVTVAGVCGWRSTVERDGRLVAQGNARWNHQMCIVGYDGDEPSGENYYFCLNSWGVAAHDMPIDGSPPGGVWLTEDQLERLVRQGDSFAYSDFDGFPAQDLDFSIFSAQVKEDDPCVPAFASARQWLLAL